MDFQYGWNEPASLPGENLEEKYLNWLDKLSDDNESSAIKRKRITITVEVEYTEDDIKEAIYLDDTIYDYLADAFDELEMLITNYEFKEEDINE